jgi:hypothetical protein
VVVAGADPNKEPVVDGVGAPNRPPVVAGLATDPKPPKPVPVLVVAPNVLVVVGMVVVPKPVPNGFAPKTDVDGLEVANGFGADVLAVLPNNPPVVPPVVDMGAKPDDKGCDGAPKTPVDGAEVPNPPNVETCCCCCCP